RKIDTGRIAAAAAKAKDLVIFTGDLLLKLGYPPAEAGRSVSTPKSESKPGGQNAAARRKSGSRNSPKVGVGVCAIREIQLQKGIRVAGIEMIQSIKRLESNFENP